MEQYLKKTLRQVLAMCLLFFRDDGDLKFVFMVFPLYHGKGQVIASGFRSSTRALVGIDAGCVVRCVDG